MSNRSAEIKTTFLHLNRETQSPYHPDLTESVINLLPSQIQCIPFDGERAGSGDLIIQRTNPVELALVMESLAPYMGTYQRDLELMIRRMETSSQPMSWLFVIAPYLELRDDRPFMDAQPIADILTEDLARADINNKIIGIGIWNPHSTLGLDFLRKNFQKKEQNILIIPLTAMPLFADEFRKLMVSKDREEFVIVAIDLGSLHQSMLLARELNLPVVLFDKSRPKIGEVKFHGLYIANPETGFAMEAALGILEGKTALILDDSLATTRTLADGATELKNDYRVSEIHAAVTHTVYVMPDAQLKLGTALDNGTIDTLFVTDTLPSCHDIERAKIISVAELTALLMKAMAGLTTEKENALLGRFIYNTGPMKEELNTLFKEKRLVLDPGAWPYNKTPLHSLSIKEIIYAQQL